MNDGVVHHLAVQVRVCVEDDSSKQLWLTRGQALCLSHLIMCFRAVVVALTAANSCFSNGRPAVMIRFYREVRVVLWSLPGWTRDIHHLQQQAKSIRDHHRLFVILHALCPYMVFPVRTTGPLHWFNRRRTPVCVSAAWFHTFSRSSGTSGSHEDGESQL